MRSCGRAQPPPLFRWADTKGYLSTVASALVFGAGIGTVMDLWARRTDPTLSTFLAVADALGVRSIEELMGVLGTNAMTEHQRRSRPAGPT
jgi:hypothetical protein